MTFTLKDLCPVYVVGIEIYRSQFTSETPYIELGLADAGLAWPAVESAYFAKALLPMAPGRAMLRHLGATGLSIVHVENASASGSAAFRHAAIEVAAGITDISLVVGVDKPMPLARAESLARIGSLADDAIAPFTHFAQLADAYAARTGASVEGIALVAVKNHRNGAKNPFAQHQKERTLDEILNGKRIAGRFTSLQCTPVGEGAAAVIVASEAGLLRYGIGLDRAVRVVSSAGRSQRVYDDPTRHDAMLTEETTKIALAEAQVGPRELDVVELHDAFTVEEVEYVEAMGLCAGGQAVPLLKEGAFDIGGRCAISPSGGLIAMGHPIGPTGVGQIGEITRQLRGEAGSRQQPNARIGLAHMVGIGAVCYVHVLQAS